MIYKSLKHKYNVDKLEMDAMFRLRFDSLNFYLLHLVSSNLFLSYCLFQYGTGANYILRLDTFFLTTQFYPARKFILSHVYFSFF